MEVLIIGSGVIGVTTAYELARDGHSVTVVDRQPAAALETSFANGGLITPSQSDPWNAPGSLRRLLSWLGREDSPLLLRPRALPGMLGWGLRFVHASRPQRYRRSAHASARLGLYSVARLDELRDETSIAYHALDKGTLKIFTSRQSLAEAEEVAAMLAEDGLEYRRLEARDAVALEPALKESALSLAGAIHYPNDKSGDAHVFTTALAGRCRQMGVQFLTETTVQRLETANGIFTGVQTSSGNIRADACVLAAGSYSPLLARGAGLKLPIYPVKGYSITIPIRAPFEPPQIPIVDFDRKIVMAPLGERMRIAGTAEFAGYDTRPNLARSRSVLALAQNLFPQLTDAVAPDEIGYWTGLRPMSCDGPPLLGPTPVKGLFLNTGHGPLGWTLACGSARIVADCIADKATAISLDGLTLGRFAWRRRPRLSPDPAGSGLA